MRPNNCEYDYAVLARGKLFNRNSKLDFLTCRRAGVVETTDEADIEPHYLCIAYGLARRERANFKTAAELKAIYRAGELRERAREESIKRRFGNDR